MEGCEGPASGCSRSSLGGRAFFFGGDGLDVVVVAAVVVDVVEVVVVGAVVEVLEVVEARPGGGVMPGGGGGGDARAGVTWATGVKVFFFGDEWPLVLAGSKLAILELPLRPRDIVNDFFSFFSFGGATGDGVAGGNPELLRPPPSGMRVLASFVGRDVPTGAMRPLPEDPGRPEAGRTAQFAVRGRAGESGSSADGFGHADFCVNGGGCS